MCIRDRSWIMSGFYCLSDLAAVFFAVLLAYFLRKWTPEFILPPSVLMARAYIELWPAIFLFEMCIRDSRGTEENDTEK